MKRVESENSENTSVLNRDIEIKRILDEANFIENNNNIKIFFESFLPKAEEPVNKHFEVTCFTDERKDKLIEAFKGFLYFLETTKDSAIVLDLSQPNASTSIIKNSTVKALSKEIEIKEDDKSKGFLKSKQPTFFNVRKSSSSINGSGQIRKTKKTPARKQSKKRKVDKGPIDTYTTPRTIALSITTVASSSREDLPIQKKSAEDQAKRKRKEK